MQPSPLLWLPWLLVVAGDALAASYVLRTFRAALNADAFTTVVRKLLDARNADRAMKLTHAAPDSPLAAALRAAIVACGAGVDQNDPNADYPSANYRSAGDLSPERILAPVRARYDEAFEGLAGPVRAARYAAIPGALLLVAALGSAALSAIAHGPWQAPAAVAAFSLVVLAWTANSEATLIQSRDAMFTALADSFASLIRTPQREAPAPQYKAPTGLRIGFEVSEPGREPRVVDSDANVIKIGSDARSQVQLGAPGVARMHAVVEASDAGFSVIDLGATPQTRVNGVGVNRYALSDGDVLAIGDAELRVRLYR